MIGCCVWIIVLRRFDIAYATSSMSIFRMSPREGHLKTAKTILSYLKTFSKGRIINDTIYPDHSIYPIKDHPNGKDFYLDAEEEVPNYLPTPKKKKSG
jgi:hypothetical protein